MPLREGGGMFFRKLIGIFAIAAIVIATPLVVLLSNLYFLATPAFLRMEYGKPGFPEAPGFTNEERLQQADASVAYLRSSSGIEALAELTQDDQPLYNERELSHMADVKVVMYWAFAVQNIALAVLVIMVIYVLARRDLRGWLPKAVFWGCAALAGAILLVGLAAGINFDIFFVLFHQLFFTGDSWLFLSTDSLIRLFPLPFWMDAAAIWVILAFGEAVIIGTAAYLWPGWKHRR
jgi:integral membrane protein (TIGR01906 family)